MLTDVFIGFAVCLDRVHWSVCILGSQQQQEINQGWLAQELGVTDMRLAPWPSVPALRGMWPQSKQVLGGHW